MKRLDVQMIMAERKVSHSIQIAEWNGALSGYGNNIDLPLGHEINGSTLTILITISKHAQLLDIIASSGFPMTMHTAYLWTLMHVNSQK